MKIDLHTHTTYSDGTFSVDDNVRIAKENGLLYLALTDHNTVKGFDDLMVASQKYGQSVIKGCEFSTAYSREIHMLGYFPYNFDINAPEAEKVRYLVDNYEQGKMVQIRTIINNLSKDIDVDADEFLEFAKTLKDNTNYNRTHIGAYLVHKGYVKDYSEAFDHYLSDKGPYYVEKENIDLFEAARMVSEAKGLVSVAHIKQYRQLDDEKVKQMLLGICPYVQDLGVELYHYDHGEEDIARIRRICQQVSQQTGINIFYTSGSDCHGDKKRNHIGDFSGQVIGEQTCAQRDEDLAKTLEIFKKYHIIAE